MPVPDRDRAGLLDGLVAALRWIVPAYACLLLPLVVDRLDPGAEPVVDLTGTFATIAWVFAESGQTLGIVVIAAVLLAVLATRPGPTTRRRVLELAVVTAMSVGFLYGGKLLNDHVVKPAVGTARPSIVELAEVDVLGMSVDAFYDLPQDERSAHLDRVKSPDGFGPIAMSPEVRDHWVKETAFSRPSGHALAAMTFATYYVALAAAWLSGWRRRAFQLLVPWAVLVCLSRPVLRVHWPLDVLIGAAAGIALGCGAYVVTRWVLGPVEPVPPVTPRRGTPPADPDGSC